MSKVNKPEELHPEDRREDLIDRGLVAMFLKLSPEERLRANDNAARTILELRNAYRAAAPGSGRNAATIGGGIWIG